jgi:hypothetical protein
MVPTKDCVHCFDSRLLVCGILCVRVGKKVSESRAAAGLWRINKRGVRRGAPTKGAPKGGGGAAELQPPKTLKPKFKKTDFCRYYDIKLLRDLPFSRNQPLKSADDSTLEF